MLKFLYKIIFILILLFGIRIYTNYMMTGQTPTLSISKPELQNISISKLTDSLSDKVNVVKNKVTPDTKKTETYLYKWRDKKGVIHYTSEKPSDEINNLESIKIDNQTNVVPAVSDNSANVDPIQEKSANSSTTMPNNLYSPEGVKQLFDQAKNVQNLMNEQFSQQEQALENN
jgi:hypothetical protein